MKKVLAVVLCMLLAMIPAFAMAEEATAANTGVSLYLSDPVVHSGDTVLADLTGMTMYIAGGADADSLGASVGILSTADGSSIANGFAEIENGKVTFTADGLSHAYQIASDKMGITGTEEMTALAEAMSTMASEENLTQLMNGVGEAFMQILTDLQASMTEEGTETIALFGTDYEMAKSNFALTEEQFTTFMTSVMDTLQSNEGIKSLMELSKDSDTFNFNIDEMSEKISVDGSAWVSEDGTAVRIAANINSRAADQEAAVLETIQMDLVQAEDGIQMTYTLEQPSNGNTATVDMTATADEAGQPTINATMTAKQDDALAGMTLAAMPTTDDNGVAGYSVTMEITGGENQTTQGSLGYAWFENGNGSFAASIQGTTLAANYLNAGTEKEGVLAEGKLDVYVADANSGVSYELNTGIMVGTYAYTKLDLAEKYADSLVDATAMTTDDNTALMTELQTLASDALAKLAKVAPGVATLFQSLTGTAAN